MQNITWKGIRLRVQSYNVAVGGSQLELRRFYRDAGGVPILMLPGFLENTSVFLSSSRSSQEGGLAPFLASQGFDVYLAELRGKGNSWPRITRNAKWGLHEAISEDIPAHLGMLERLRPGAGQFWLGQGLGSLILTAAYARLQTFKAPVLGMVHIGAARRVNADSFSKRNAYRWWKALTATSRVFSGCASWPFRKSAQRESAASTADWKRWLRSEAWLGPQDGFDFAAALRQRPLPASLYLANQKNRLWGGAGDCREWINELGPHDARLMIIGKPGGNKRNYSFRDLLQDPTACDDHFHQINSWLQEHVPSEDEPQRSA